MPRKKQQTDEEISEDYDEDEEFVSKKKKSIKKKPAKKIKIEKSESEKNESQVQQQPKPKRKAVKKQVEGDEIITKKKQDKKDFIIGQKYPSPEEDDGALAFYQSLYEQNPNSEMAKKYCLQYGLLQKNEAMKVAKELSKK